MPRHVHIPACTVGRVSAYKRKSLQYLQLFDQKPLKDGELKSGLDKSMKSMYTLHNEKYFSAK